MTGARPGSGGGGFNQAGDAEAAQRAMEQQRNQQEEEFRSYMARQQQAEAQRVADAQAQQATAVAQPSPAATMTPSQPPTMFRGNTYNPPMENNQAPITFNPGLNGFGRSRFGRRSTKGRGR